MVPKKSPSKRRRPATARVRKGKARPQSGRKRPEDAPTAEPAERTFQRREPGRPKNMYTYANGNGFFFERQFRGTTIREPLGKSPQAAMRRAIDPLT